MEHTFLFRRPVGTTRTTTWIVVGSLCAIALGVGLLFAVRGAWLILAYAAVEVFVLVAAVRTLQRRSTDFDLLRVRDDDVLLVRQRDGRQHSFRCARYWARVALPEDEEGADSLLLRLQGRAVSFAPNLDRSQGLRLARELNGLFAASTLPARALHPVEIRSTPIAIRKADP